MARTALLLTFLILSTGLGTALSFNVDVSEETDHTVKDLNYSEEVAVNQEITGVVSNIGSIGCTFRFKGEFSQGNETFERYSRPHSLWAGANSEIELNYIPMNYTGLVDTNLSVEYCGQEKEVDSFEFNVTEKTLPGAEIDSRTVEADESQASVEISSGDLLVPEESPSYWKLGSAEVINGSATVDYDAPIFSEGEKLRYTVLEDGEIVGTTEVSLEAEPTRLEKALKYKFEAAAGLLVLSILGNIVLFLERKGVEIEVPEYDLPDFRKTD